MRFVLTALIVLALFLLVTVEVALRTRVELPPGWYLQGPTV